MKKILAAVCFTALFSTLAAGDFWPASRIADKPDGITELKVSSSIYSNRLYPVNPEEKYILSGEFRAAPETVATDFWFGLIPCDTSRKQFGPRNIWVVKGTETVLAAPCKKEDKSILIKKADGWKTGKIYLAAFGKESPCFQISEVGITAIQPENGAFRVNFRNPVGQDCPAGTEVRMHQDAESAIWCGANRKVTSGEWQTFRGVVSGNSGTTVNQKQFPEGTRFAVITIAVRFRSGLPCALQFRNVKLELAEEE